MEADIPPRWPPNTESLKVDNTTYEVRVVPLSSISLVTNKMLKVGADLLTRHIFTRKEKVDVSGIFSGPRKSVMFEAVTSLQLTVQDWLSRKAIPEVDWERMRRIEFQEALQARNVTFQRVQNLSCTLCEQFDDHVCHNSLLRGRQDSLSQYLTLHSEKLLQAKINDLKHEISEQNLALVPDYEQRVAVLKDLKFVNENSTVQLKGRVACEVLIPD